MSPSPTKGFTLVEILAVITTVSVISVVILPRLSLSNPTVNESKASLITALTTARQLAMFSSDKTNSVQFILDNNTMSIRKGNQDVTSAGINYPNSLHADVEHSPASILVNFNTLGETKGTNITLHIGDKTESVIVHPTGYIQ